MSQTEVSGPALGARMRQDALRIPLVTTHSGDQPTPNPTDRLVEGHNQTRWVGARLGPRVARPDGVARAGSRRRALIAQ